MAFFEELGKKAQAVAGVAAVALPHRLPRPERFPWQIPPWRCRPEPVDHAVHHATIITERMTTPPHIRRQQADDSRRVSGGE